MLYLDHNATTPVLSEARDAMTEVLQGPYNPSSVHAFGRRAKAMLEEARKNVANMLGVDLRKDDYALVFTSSGTEANNLVMGFKGKVLISAMEHNSVMRHADLKDNVAVLEVDSNGIVKLDCLEEWMQDNSGSLVSVMLANNETGILQPIKEIAALVHKYGCLLHCDCVQAVGKIDVNIKDLGMDFATISGHKFGAPSGVGALIFKEKYTLTPMIIGGGQERGVRAGTENLAGIVGMGVAARLHAMKSNEIPRQGRHDYILLRDLFEAKIREVCSEAVIFGAEAPRLPNTSMLAMPGVLATQQLIAFDMAGIALSSGSACSSGKVKPSHVLRAMGVPENLAECAVRVSFGKGNTEEDVEKLAEEWIKIWKKKDE